MPVPSLPALQEAKQAGPVPGWARLDAQNLDAGDFDAAGQENGV